MAPRHRDIKKQAEAQGWRVRSGKKHVLIYPPDGSRPHPIPRGANTSDKGRQDKNSRSALRKKGLDV